MIKKGRALERSVTARLHEYEDYLAGKTADMKISCDVCHDTCPVDCDLCPFNTEGVYFGCLTPAREAMHRCISRDRRQSPPKKVCLARYNELLRALRKNGWKYD
jgi:hypothetical protein